MFAKLFIIVSLILVTKAQLWNGIVLTSCWDIGSGAGTVRVNDLGTNIYTSVATPQNLITNPGIKNHVDRQRKIFTLGYRTSTGYVTTYTYTATSLTLQRTCNVTDVPYCVASLNGETYFIGRVSFTYKLYKLLEDCTKVELRTVADVRGSSFSGQTCATSASQNLIFWLAPSNSTLYGYNPSNNQLQTWTSGIPNFSFSSQTYSDILQSLIFSGLSSSIYSTYTFKPSTSELTYLHNASASMYTWGVDDVATNPILYGFFSGAKAYDLYSGIQLGTKSITIPSSSCSSIVDPTTSIPSTTAPITASPQTTASLTTSPQTTSALTTSPQTSAALTTSPQTTAPLTSAAVTSGQVTSGQAVGVTTGSNPQSTTGSAPSATSGINVATTGSASQSGTSTGSSTDASTSAQESGAMMIQLATFAIMFFILV